ncbi:Arm DNA-binding domain-containing protein [Phocaeicola vulgatus]|nr:Arm DNA-binding domain-containing protein [Phocaeicola vulgatus]
MGITLGKKQLNKGRVSLYLNYSYNGKRRKEYLGIILGRSYQCRAKSGKQKQGTNCRADKSKEGTRILIC